jgi:transcriptional regulator with XRE-family HTH domain
VPKRARRLSGVAARLQACRTLLGLTQEGIARRAHVTAKYISEIENGHASPTIAVLERVVELGLGMPMSAFFSTEVAADVRDDLAKLRALLGGQPVKVRQQALRVVRALVEG